MSEFVKHLFVSAKADGADPTLVQPGDWNDGHVIYQLLTNNSGVSLVANDVVVQNTGADKSVDDTTIIGSLAPVWVALEGIADGVQGKFRSSGIAVVSVQGAMPRGEFLRTSATARAAERCLPAGTVSGLPAGAFGVSLTAFAGPGVGTVEALLFGFTAQPGLPKGPDVASASALSPDPSGGYFHVTGTTTITSIASRPAGSILVLEFDSTPIVQHNATTLIIFDGADFSAQAGSTLTLVSEGGGNWREVARSGSTFNPETRAQLYEDWLSGTTAGSYSWNIGGRVIITSQVGGVIEIGGAGDSGNIQTATVFQAAKKPKVSMRMAQSSTGGTETRFGLGGAGFGGDPSNGIYFRQLTSGANYIAVCRSGGVESTLDTAVAGASGVFHKFKLHITTTSVTVFVDGVNKGSITTNIPTVVLLASAGVNNSIVQAWLDYIFIEQER